MERRGGRRDEGSEKMKKLLKKMKNEKVAKGRIIGLAGPCFNLIPRFRNLKKRVTDRPTDRRTHRRTDPLIEMRGRI